MKLEGVGTCSRLVLEPLEQVEVLLTTEDGPCRLVKVFAYPDQGVVYTGPCVNKWSVYDVQTRYLSLIAEVGMALRQLAEDLVDEDALFDPRSGIPGEFLNTLNDLRTLKQIADKYGYPFPTTEQILDGVVEKER